MTLDELMQTVVKPPKGIVYPWLYPMDVFAVQAWYRWKWRNDKR